MARTVSQAGDGFWRVSGQPETQFYATQATAKRVAANLDAADVPAGDQPSTLVSEAQQTADIAAAGTAAASALSEVGGAISVALSAQAAASGAVLAAVAAQTAAAAAQATANAAAAAVAPLFLDERFRARFRSLLPTGRPAIMFDELERCYSAPGETQVGGWIASGAAIYTNERGTCVKCPGGGPGTNNAIHRNGSAALGGQRAKRWHMGGAAHFVGPVGPGSGEWRAFMLINAPGNLPGYMIGMGLFADISETKFVFRVQGDHGVQSSLSTIDYSPGLHILEMWWGLPPGPGESYGPTNGLMGSVDGEAPIYIGTGSPNDMPDGPLYQWHGVINGSDTMYLDAVGIASER